jgi:magnesium-transporting ATPase (P-type)
MIVEGERTFFYRHTVNNFVYQARSRALPRTKRNEDDQTDSLLEAIVFAVVVGAAICAFYYTTSFLVLLYRPLWYILILDALVVAACIFRESRRSTDGSRNYFVRRRTQLSLVGGVFLFVFIIVTIRVPSVAIARNSTVANVLDEGHGQALNTVFAMLSKRGLGETVVVFCTLFGAYVLILMFCLLTAIFVAAAWSEMRQRPIRWLDKPRSRTEVIVSGFSVVGATLFSLGLASAFLVTPDSNYPGQTPGTLCGTTSSGTSVPSSFAQGSVSTSRPIPRGTQC